MQTIFLLLNLQPMKKHFVLAICCFALFFSSCNKTDDPNGNNDNPTYENYVGNYSGKLATYTKITFPWDSESDINTMDLSMSITPGNEDNQVNASCVAYGQTFSMTGSIADGKVTFEPVTISVAASQILNIEFLENLHLSDIVDATVELTYNYTGEMMHDNLLNVNYLYLDGTNSGKLIINILGLPTSCPINGTAKGRVNRIE